MRVLRLVAVWVVALLLVAGCSGGQLQVEQRDPGVVRVSSFDFPESRLLAELYGEQLRRSGFRVEVLAGLGTREVVVPAQEQGLVDLVPHYTGSLLDHLGASVADTHGSAEDVYQLLRQRLGPLGLTALRYAPAEDVNGFAVRRAFAREKALVRLSDLRPLAGGLTFGGPPECQTRRYCLAGLRETYGLRFESFRALPSRAATATALESGEIDVGLLETTYGRLGDRRVVLLVDDLRLQPRENVVPVVRTEVVSRLGARFAEAVDGLSARLDTDDLIRLNRLGAVDPRGPAEVAATFLGDL